MKKRCFFVLLLVLLIIINAALGCSKSDSSGIKIERSTVIYGENGEKGGSPVLTPAPSSETDTAPATQTPEATPEPTPSEENKSDNNLYTSVSDKTVSLGICITSDVNVRKDASTSGDIVAKLSIGEIVEIINKEEADRWYRIYKDGTEVFASSDFIYVIVDSNELNSIGKATITKDDVNKRCQPSSSSETLGKLAKDTELDIVIADTQGWTFLYDGTSFFYVSSEFVSQTE